MRLHGSAARLTILVDEADQWHHRPLYVEIIHRAHRAGLAGATALRGIEGFAALSEIHTTHLFTLGEHLPVVIVIVDDHRRVQQFVDSLDEILPKGVALLDDVEVIRYHADPGHQRRRRAAGPTGDVE
jgi:PII-like signaling protein